MSSFFQLILQTLGRLSESFGKMAQIDEIPFDNSVSTRKSEKFGGWALCFSTYKRF